MKPLWPYQREDADTLVRVKRHIFGNDPGMGKTRTILTAACEMWPGEIDAVVVVCPATARSVWVDPDPALGEISKWMVRGFPHEMRMYHAKWPLRPPDAEKLTFLVTNPEFIRRPDRLDPLIAWAKRQRTLLVGDESWQWQNPLAKQTKAMAKLREACVGVALLNGTLGEPKQQYAQIALLGKDILGVKNWYAFRNRYCKMGGWMNKEIVGYQRMDEFHEKTAPYVTVRRIRDYLDIGAVPNRTTITATLTPRTWKIYHDMAQDMLVWLNETDAATASQAAVLSMRLAQIANGFVGGIESDEQSDLLSPPETIREVGDEKVEALINWLPANWAGDKLLVFTRFRADVERTAFQLSVEYPNHEVRKLYGDQHDEERTRAKILLAPGGDPTPAIVVANTQSGGAGLNFAATNLCVFLANDYSLKTRVQAEGRIDRPGQTRHVTFADVIATGPNGQNTIDHAIVAALRRKESVSEWSLEQWKAIL